MSILSHRGFSFDKQSFKPDLIRQYKKDLTIVPFVEREEYAYLAQPIKLYQETAQRIYVPRFYASRVIGKPDNDKLTTKNFAICENLKFVGQLRPNQIVPVKTMLDSLDNIGGGVISVFCGGGKTSMSIYCACQKKVKTAVVCHTTSMMKQWQERLQQFCPTARIGVVQQSQATIEDKDFIIISVKTVALRQYPKGTFESIGLVIWDEIHLMCTNLFSQAFPKLATKYSIGLSATPYRKDKCESVFLNYIGPVVFMSKQEKDTSIEAHCVSLKMEGIETIKDISGKMLYTSMAVATVNRKERSNYIAELIADLGSKGRNVLVLGEYVQHLKDLLKIVEEMAPLKPAIPQKVAFMMAWNKRLGENSPLKIIPEPVGVMITKYLTKPVTIGLYIGEMKNQARKMSEEKDVILGTYKLASVGMDIPALNTLIMATPRKEIEQSVGRILRKQKGEAGFAPLIYDIIDNHNVFNAQARDRKKFYATYGYTIVNTKVLPDGTVLSKRVVKQKDAKTTNNKEAKSTINKEAKRRTYEEMDDDGDDVEKSCMFGDEN